MQRVFRVVETRLLKPAGLKVTAAFTRSVRRYGVLNPVLLAEVVDVDGVISLAIIDGNRRIRAAQSARLSKVPAVVLLATTKEDRARLTLICNYMRSLNFHTESAAILSLATDEDAAAEAARAIGLGPVKMQQLHRKIATMPEPVRRAMYEHRIPVTAATWVGAWPEGLQQEAVELLGWRRYVNTTMMKDLREWYAERHPEEFEVAEPAKQDVPFDEWSDTSRHVVEIPAPPAAPDEVHGGEVTSQSNEPSRDHVPAPPQELAPPSNVAPVAIRPDGQYREVFDIPKGSGGAAHSRNLGDPGSMGSSRDDPADAQPGSAPQVERPAQESPAGSSPAVSPAAGMVPAPSGRPPLVGPYSTNGEPSRSLPAGPHASSDVTVVVGVSSASDPTIDDRAERLVAFVKVLDATLRDLAQEGYALGIDRSVWVDRTMRAWARFGG